MYNKKIATALVSLCVLFGASSVAYAVLPVPAHVASNSFEEKAEPKVNIGKVEFVSAPEAPKVVTKKAAPAKARKRVCDKRMHTVSVSHSNNVHTVNKSETGVTVCWWE